MEFKDMKFEDSIKEVLNNYFVFTDSENRKEISKNTDLSDESKIASGRKIYLLVGPAGSGKTTLLANMYKQNVFGNTLDNFVPFINRYYNSGKVLASASEEREYKEHLLSSGKSIIMETASLDENYVQFLKELSDKYSADLNVVYLTKLNPKDNIDRVKERKTQGGHGKSELDVTEQEKMYSMNAKNLNDLLSVCKTCTFVYNTSRTKDNPNAKPEILFQKNSNAKYEYGKNERVARILLGIFFKHCNININFRVIESKKEIINENKKGSKNMYNIKDKKQLGKDGVVIKKKDIKNPQLANREIVKYLFSDLENQEELNKKTNPNADSGKGMNR